MTWPINPRHEALPRRDQFRVYPEEIVEVVVLLVIAAVIVIGLITGRLS